MSTSEAPEERPSDPQPSIRWWPAVAVLMLAAGILIAIWQFEDEPRQTKNLQSGFLALVTAFLLFLWLMLLSRLRWTRRLLLLGVAAGLVLLLVATLEIRGVTGDLIPIVEWRWSRPTSQRLPVEQASVVAEGSTNPIASAGDYPQLYGPSRNGRLSEIQLATDWDAQPPQLLWRQPIGAAWSGFAVVGQYAVTTEQRGESELVSCYQLRSGNLFWTHADDSHFLTVIAGEGPRSVPAIAEGHVYTLGPTGILNCQDLIDGEVIWSKNILTENDSPAPEWGLSCSPLVAGGKVIVSAGGKPERSLIAYDAESGDLIWSGGSDGAGYSSPVLGNIAGVDQVLIFNGPGVKSHDFNTGEILWEYPWQTGSPHITLPIVLPDGRVLISSGYGVGSELVQVSHDPTSGWSVSQIWKSRFLKSKFANMIVHKDFIYGLDDGIFVCLELATGERRWKAGRYGHGQLMLVDDLILVMAENGELVLIEPTPEELRELSRFSVLSSKTWNPPALAGEYLLVRNDKEAACYRLPTRKP